MTAEEPVMMTCKVCGTDFLWVHRDGLCGLCYGKSFPIIQEDQELPDDPR